MVSPERKRTATRHLQGSRDVSERWACATIRRPRSAQRYRGQRRDKDAALAGGTTVHLAGAVARGLPDGGGAAQACRHDGH